jgi:hypothetical protein
MGRIVLIAGRNFYVNKSTDKRTKEWGVKNERTKEDKRKRKRERFKE